ncbi:MAG TPA: hypothetical protein VK155_16570 [Bacteroidales bacterium]|jgi:hypothetical protein|nr:hypothetical protein [Bacteroidales bacterium]
MKIRNLIASLSFLLVVAPLSGQTAFNGEWKIDTNKSAVPTDQLYLSKINIQVKADSILTTRVYQSPDGQEFPFQENMSLNGKETKLTIYDMPRVTKAQKGEGGSILIDSKTTFYGNGGEDNLTAQETWKVDGNTLVLNMVNQMSGQEYKGTFYYNK